MTKVFLEVELDLETHYRQAVPAKLNPPPGDPPEPEEIEVISLDEVRFDDVTVRLPSDVSEALLEELLANDVIKAKIEERIREDALDG